MQFNFVCFTCIYYIQCTTKSELVEDREGKSALYGVICCCDNRLLSRAAVCGHTVKI